MKNLTRDKKKTYSQPIAEVLLITKDVIMASAITDSWQDFQGKGELY